MSSTNRRFEIEGEDLGYPTLFRDGRSAQGLFVVNAGVVNELIADSGFRAAEIAPGRGVLSLNCVHYTDTDCGTYLETTQTFFVDRVGGGSRIPYLGTWADLARGRVASYTWALQVTTVLSQQAGIQMWGFPKTIEDIELDLSAGWARFSMRMDGRDVFRYAVRAEGSRAPAPLATPVYSIWESAPHVSMLSQEYRDAGYRPGGGVLELGDHPMADQLRALGLPRRPLLAVWTGHLSFSMSAPEKL